MKHINLLDLENEVRRLAAENPDFVYEGAVEDRYGSQYVSCMYTVEGDDENLVGSCLFGQALINLGADPAELRSYEHEGIGQVLESAMLVSPKRVQWFDDVQEYQDVKMTWAFAVAEADDLQAARAALPGEQ